MSKSIPRRMKLGKLHVADKIACDVFTSCQKLLGKFGLVDAVERFKEELQPLLKGFDTQAISKRDMRCEGTAVIVRLAQGDGRPEVSQERYMRLPFLIFEVLAQHIDEDGPYKIIFEHLGIETDDQSI